MMRAVKRAEFFGGEGHCNPVFTGAWMLAHYNVLMLTGGPAGKLPRISPGKREIPANFPQNIMLRKPRAARNFAKKRLTNNFAMQYS
ncbi:MAG: hypothetical protein MPK10_09625, partial [Gammaproteobacteria bacterium]|nr:hypothetical protein [Gammaproteobacteria bacterium]